MALLDFSNATPNGKLSRCRSTGRTDRHLDARTLAAMKLEQLGCRVRELAAQVVRARKFAQTVWEDQRHLADSHSSQAQIVEDLHQRVAQLEVICRLRQMTDRRELAGD